MNVVEFIGGYSQFLLLLGTNITLAVALWLTVGHNIEAFAVIGFMAIGAYGALASSHLNDIPIYIGIPFGASVAAMFGLLLAFILVRLHALFLAIATVAFSAVVSNVFSNIDYLGGSLGVSGIPVRIGLVQVWITAVAAVVIGVYLTRGRTGRELAAFREDPTAAAACGVRIRGYEAMLFTLQGFLAGAAGGLFAFSNFFVEPSQFGFGRLVSVVAFVVVGGLASAVGAALGAIALTSLIEFARWFSGLELFVEGVVLLLMVIFLRDGLLGGIDRLARTIGSIGAFGGGLRSQPSRPVRRRR